jgi:hypothetical protein
VFVALGVLLALIILATFMGVARGRAIRQQLRAVQAEQAARAAQVKQRAGGAATSQPSEAE